MPGGVQSLADLYATAHRLLGLFVEQLDGLDVTLPERRYVSPGQIPAWDGEQLTVNLIGLAQGQPGLPIGTSFSPTAANYHAQYAVSLIRAITVVGLDGGPVADLIPPQEDIDADSLLVLGDATALIRAGQNLHQDYLAVQAGEGFLFELQTVGPDGGMAGHRLILTLSID